MAFHVNIIVGCEFSGTVRDAFIQQGHNAVSCDLLPSDSPGPHIQADVLKHLDDGWDMGIFFPPCTDLAGSGARWFAQKRADGRQQASISFFMALAESRIPKLAIENPVGIMSNVWRKPDQIVQPWQFGHGETKATCLWLKNLPPLIATRIVPGREQRIWRLPPSPTRWAERSRTFPGIAEAMAEQWG